MTVFLAWSASGFPDEVVGTVVGPWREVRRAAHDLVLVDSDDTLSRVYHELKWALNDGAALLVAPLGDVPKLRGLPPGTQTWLRTHADPRPPDVRS
ncbi:hypothetical protein BH09ACT12_BH09ACT12_00900 [soil metagenome]